MSYSVNICGKLRPKFSKVTGAYEWFCTKRAQKVPVSQFFKSILITPELHNPETNPSLQSWEK